MGNAIGDLYSDPYIGCLRLGDVGGLEVGLGFRVSVFGGI